jgi:hypothetical protein
MFDFRYHVASLAAVFLALVVGIVIGVGLSGQGVVQESERVALNDQIEDLNAELKLAQSRTEEELAATEFVEASYSALMENRLAGKRIVAVFVGESGGGLRSAITRAITDADGTLVRLRVLKVPIDEEALLGSAESADVPAPPSDVRELGGRLADELLAGEATPLWDAVADQIVIERIPDAEGPADGVVVARAAEPQQGETARFLSGLYGGLTGSVPAVWAVADDPELPRPGGFAVLRDVGATLGRVTLAVLLETGVQGDFGPDAPTVVPLIPPVSPPPETGG